MTGVHGKLSGNQIVSIGFHYVPKIKPPLPKYSILFLKRFFGGPPKPLKIADKSYDRLINEVQAEGWRFNKGWNVDNDTCQFKHYKGSKP